MLRISGCLRGLREIAVSTQKLKPANRFTRNFDSEKLKNQNLIRTRGEILELEKVVKIMREENVLDLCVIKVPPERRYVSYFIICTVRNDSQLVVLPSALSEGM